MPNQKMDNLNNSSTDPQLQDAISSEIEACMLAPTPSGVVDADKRKYCAGKAYGMVKSKTGKESVTGGNS